MSAALKNEFVELQPDDVVEAGRAAAATAHRRVQNFLNFEDGTKFGSSNRAVLDNHLSSYALPLNQGKLRRSIGELDFLPLAVPVRHKKTFPQALREWEGYVDEINFAKGTFTARLVDVTAGSKVEQFEATFAINDLDRDGQDSLERGAVFRWIIGYEFDRDGKKRVSRLVFRRLPAWTKNALAAAEESARQLLEGIHWD